MKKSAEENLIRLLDAHPYCRYNKEAILASEEVACFYCKKIFSPKETPPKNYVHKGITAICPFCNVDSLLPSSCLGKFSEEFITDMHDYWFYIPE